MRVYCIVDAARELVLDTMFSSHERAERELLDDDLSADDGYLIQSRDVPEREYCKVLAREAHENLGANLLALY